jgi:hypothetical protein
MSGVLPFQQNADEFAASLAKNLMDEILTKHKKLLFINML